MASDMNVWASPSLNLPVVKNKQESNDSKSLHSAIRYLSNLGFKSFAKIREVIYFLMNICGKSGLLLQTGTKLSFLPLSTFQICRQCLMSAGVIGGWRFLKYPKPAFIDK